MTSSQVILPQGIWFVLRAMLASPFLFSGVTKAIGFDAAIAEFDGLGLPFPALAVLATIIVQIGSAVLLLLNRWVFWAALTLAAFTIAATALAHQPWTVSGPDAIREATIVFEHLALTAGLLLAAFFSRPALSRE